MIPRRLFLATVYSVLASSLYNNVDSFFVVPTKNQNSMNASTKRTTTIRTITTTTTTTSLALGNSYMDNLDPLALPPGRMPGLSYDITRIQTPQEFLAFLAQDDRLCVIKVYAEWCVICKQFDLRYRKLVNKEGDKMDINGVVVDPGRVRFAEMDFNLNEDLCRRLDATRLPYVLMYQGASGTAGKITGFQCGPSNFQRVVNELNQHAGPWEATEIRVEAAAKKAMEAARFKEAEARAIQLAQAAEETYRQEEAARLAYEAQTMERAELTPEEAANEAQFRANEEAFMRMEAERATAEEQARLSQQ